MKKTQLTFYTCLAFFWLLTAFADVQAQQIFKTTPSSVIGFLEYVPQGYNTNSDKYPIVIFLHGLGERGPDSTDPAVLAGGVSKLIKHGPPKYVNSGTQFPFILISPQLKSNYGNWNTSYVMEVIDYVKTYLRVDEKRIYLTGLSLGGGGTWWVSQDHPTLFAAIAPVCGSRNTTSAACKLAAENLPVWAFHGEKDSTVPLSRSVNMVNAINACTPTPNPQAIMTIYPGINHNSWDNAYLTDHTKHNPNVYEWMMSYTNTINAGNKIPQANAGSDISLAASSTSITGSGSDTDGTIASYAWIQSKGPSVATLSGANTSRLTATNLVAGEYIFRLRVTDNGGQSDSDYIKVTVSGGANVAPVANAGADKTITLPTSSVSLTGTATDADGTIASYAWTKVSGGAATLSGAATATLSASALVAGSYTFRLTATDNGGATHYDDVNVTVNAAPNTAPVASAGTDKALVLPTNSVVLNGTATDTDGTIASYAWTKVSGGAATMTGQTTATLTTADLAAGSYAFRLTVTDNAGATCSDDVNVVVSSTATNTPPVANAGKGVVVLLPVAYKIMAGSGTDADGTIVAYEWSQTSGPACTLSDINTTRVKISNMVSGNYAFQLKVTDDKGATAVDEVTVKFNYLPVANAGTDATVTLPTNTLVLNGSATDTQGSIASYAWTKVSGPAVTLANANTANLSLSGLVEGSYSFQLTVKDDLASKATDIVNVTVLAAAAQATTLMVEESTAEATMATEEQHISLQDWSAFEGKNYAVVVFDAAGQKIYAGAWEENTYGQVFTGGGMYYYNIFENGVKVDTGKLFVSL